MSDNIVIEAKTAAASAHKRIDALAVEVKDLRNLTEAVIKINSKVDHLAVDMQEVKNDIKQVTSKPGQWWDKLIAAVIGACGSGIIAAVLSLILS